MKILLQSCFLTFIFFIFLFYYYYYYSYYYIHSSYCFIRVRFCPKIFYFFSVHFILNELSPSHFLTSEIFIKISSLKSLVIYHPEIRKIFRLSQNLMKLFRITRFYKTNLTAQSISSSEIYRISGFQPKLLFYHFSEKLNFSRVLH